MAKRDYIREAFFKKGKSKSEIARVRRVDRKTVRKYIEQEDWNVKFSVKRKTKGRDMSSILCLKVRASVIPPCE